MDTSQDTQHFCSKYETEIGLEIQEPELHSKSNQLPLSLNEKEAAPEPNKMIEDTESIYKQLLEHSTTKLHKNSLDKNNGAASLDFHLNGKENKNLESSKLEICNFNFKMSLVSKQLPIDIHFTDVSYYISNGWKRESKRILHEVSGRFLSGELSAILGPSGAGKSTLMNVLSGFRTMNMTGNILINGNPRCLKSFRKQSSYIMQDAHLIQYLTVKESMHAAVSLKNGISVSKSEKIILIKKLLENLKLEECQNTRVATLSGGEKKRLSIALELANNCPVLFLDEPTSGLDSQNSFYCISLLKKIAESGKTIICSIHQPSAKLFEMFDYAYALADGQCIYRGTITNLVPFMSSINLQCPPYHNPSDFLIEIASRDSESLITYLVKAVNAECDHDELKQRRKLEMEEESIEDLTGSEKMLLIHDKDNGSSFTLHWVQFYVLLIRTFRATIRNPMLSLLQFAAYLVVGIFFGILFYNIGNDANKVMSNVSCIFVSQIFVVFTSVIMTVLTFPLEIKVYIREHFNNWYSLMAYFCARTLMDLPFQLIYTIIFTAIVYYMTNQPPELPRFLKFTSFSVQASFVSQSIGLMIGSAVDAQKAVYLGVALVIPVALLSGFFATFSSVPVYIKYLMYLPFSRYAYQGIMQVIYGNGRKPLNCSENSCIFQDPQKILEHFEIEEHNLTIDYLVLGFNILLFRILGYLIFRWKLRKEQ